MKITVFGAGAVGGHVAARLALAGVTVSVVARGAHLAAIRANGITLRAGDQSFQCAVQATDDPANLGSQDLVIVAVKRSGLRTALEGIKPLITSDTRVLVAMNGLPWWFGNSLRPSHAAILKNLLDPDGSLAALLPADRLIWGMVMAGGEILEPGVILNSTPANNSLDIGYPDGHTDAAITLAAELLGRAGFRTAVTGDIRGKIWFKLLLNAGQAMVATATERTALQTVSDPETRAIVMAVMHEILAIGRAIGIDVAADPLALTDPARSAPHRSSFLQDLKAGRPLELSTTILAVRDIGRALGIPAPHLTTVAATVAARSADGARKA